MRWKPLARSTMAGAVCLTVLVGVPTAGHGLDEAGTADASSAADGRTDVAEPDASELELIRRARAEGPQPVIVEFASAGNQRSLLDHLDADDGAGFTVKREFDRLNMASGWAGPETLRELATSADVVGVYENRPTVRPALESATAVTGADQAHAAGLTGKGKTIAVIDTGVDSGHPFLAGKVVAEACFSNGGYPDDPDLYPWDLESWTLCPNGEDTQIGEGAAALPTHEYCGDTTACPHGTHVAGIAAGKNVEGGPGDGVAPDANIIAVQVMSAVKEGDATYVGGYTDDAVAGLEFVRELAGTYDIAAVNISLSDIVEVDEDGNVWPGAEVCDDSPYVRPYVKAIDDLRNAGIITVAAAGNNGMDAASSTACISNVVAVGNTEDDDALRPSTNRGELLDLFAPGTDVTSSWKDGGWLTATGTSMSAPHVAGAFALLAEKYPRATPGQLLQRMKRTGTPITYQSNGEEVTTPRLDIAAAIGR